ncbi:hypothetical protein NM208_g10802 [Fusarium decemcellulare]|uniref:Uncharacterized protein n=1 Tax=Fusarium decemcellulare TaxID=57161 RepID=A0ACC1RWK0_9HYPO|nr:hypothetical protein NM208_g10802 [Fusarium decemcellulare]
MRQPANLFARYLAYYVPCLKWMRQYKLSYLRGDLVAAVTMASFYLPMALSLAANLAHVPPIHGLYAFVFNPFIYALLGSCPQMVVGPEAAGSLLVGTVVKQNVDSGDDEENDLLHAQICGIVAGMAGAMVLIAGLGRLGFLDSVLSKPFLRGFISAIGFVIAVDQLIPELGLANLADKSGVSHGSSVEKIQFMIRNIHEAHGLTCAIAGISFLVIMVCRELKNRLQPRFPSVAYIPDRFVVVVVSAVLCWRLDWENQGVEILGTVKAANGNLLAFQWPFKLEHMPHIRSAMSTSFLIALLGFFESSVAAKSLGSSDTIQGIQLSANRELMALGIANMVGGCFMSLPAFGGYGRSKVNKSTGGKSPASSMFLSIITLFSIFFLLPYFYYLPKPVLSAMISVVAWSLIEEAPHDISFFLKIRGWSELGLMAVIFFATMFYSLTLGMAFGVGLSILMVIKHSTRPRIQILGRIPGTNRFENAEGEGSSLEFVEGCLIVKIPEPLTFANTGELKSRLRRLELYGTSKAHPALPRLRRIEMNRNVIFDIHGVISMDGSGTQVLTEIVRNYSERGVRVFFSRGPTRRDHPVWALMLNSGIVELVGGESHFVNDVEEALRLTEYEERRTSWSEPRALGRPESRNPSTHDATAPPRALSLAHDIHHNHFVTAKACRGSMVTLHGEGFTPRSPPTVIVGINEDPLVAGNIEDDNDSLRDSTASITSSILEYRHINGRPFQQSKTTEYWAPTDDQYQAGQDLAHHYNLVLLDDKLYLAPIDKDPQAILDVGTGTGIWAIDIADEFPSAEVIGTDISAVQPPWVPPNCQFQIDDAQLDWTFKPDYFDFVHMRHLYGAIDDWQKLFKQAYTHIRPGGWVESLEIDIETRSENPKVENDQSHIFKKWFQLFFECGRKTGRTWEIARDGRQEKYMREAGFTDIVYKSYKVPIGGWPQDKKMKQVGIYNGAFIEQSLDGFAIFPVGEVLGWSKEEVTVLVSQMRAALKAPKSLPFYTSHLVYGRKPVDAPAATENA